MIFVHNKRTVTIIICIMMVLLSTCVLLNDPPSPAEARKFLDRNRQDIETVVEYLMSLECDEATISKPLNRDPGKVFYEFELHDISSKEVVASIKRLWRAGCTIARKDNQGENNTISFMIWSRTRGQIECGIAMTINGHGIPKTVFQTKYEEIGDGWFYYFDDFEEYRSHSLQYAEYQPQYGTDTLWNRLTEKSTEQNTD